MQLVPSLHGPQAPLVGLSHHPHHLPALRLGLASGVAVKEEAMTTDLTHADYAEYHDDWGRRYGHWRGWAMYHGRAIYGVIRTTEPVQQPATCPDCLETGRHGVNCGGVSS
jgi:hypothetical protein